MVLHEEFLFIYAIPGKDNSPNAKETPAIVPIWLRHLLPTFSVANTRAVAPIAARPNPLKNLKAENIHTLVEKMVMREAMDIVRQESVSKFFLPREVSASVPRTQPPSKQPRKKDEAGRPFMKELAHSRSQSDMIVL